INQEVEVENVSILRIDQEAEVENTSILKIDQEVRIDLKGGIKEGIDLKEGIEEGEGEIKFLLFELYHSSF
ncbi:9803_t:CDS:1, partial [Funneliformis geosporum]